MKRAIVFLPLLLLPFSLAFDCNSLEGEDIEFCKEVVASSLNDNEKELSIAEVINKKTYYPDHSFIYDWNTDIEFNQAPEGTRVYSSGYIKDAWLRIVAIMPSVIEDELLSSGVGKMLSAFNYRVEIPSNYRSSGYPRTSQGDCRREYRLKYNRYWLYNYANGHYIGNQRLVNFNSKSDINFNVKLKVKTQTEVKHWKWHSWCCSRKDGECVKVCHDCRYSGTTNLLHEVNVNENKFVKYYNPEIEPKFKLINEYYGTKQGKLDIDNFASFSLNFDDSYYRKFNYCYDLDWSLKPYPVFTLKANRFDKESSNNINVENIEHDYKFFVYNTDDCSIDIFTHFENWRENCFFKNIPIDLEISTDKLTYSEEDIIKVDLEPKGVDIKLTYGDKTVTAQDNAEFMVKYPHNKITANLEERKVQRVIHVKKKDSWDFVMNMGVFSSIMYVFYVVIKKYFGIILQF